MQFQIHCCLPPDPGRARTGRKNHSAIRQRWSQAWIRNRGSRAHRARLCSQPSWPRNRDPSLFFCLCAPATRAVRGTAVAGPRVSARRAESFGSGHGPHANTPAGCSGRSSPRSTLALGHTGGIRKPACRSADNQTPEPPPAPPTRPPTGRWTAPGRAGIKALLNGSPPSNRNGRGPGVDGQIVPGPSLILIEVATRRPRRRATLLQRSSGISWG